MEKNLAILGSTGSIGCQALSVARRLHLPISALAANRNIDLLETQIREFRPQLVAVFDFEAAKKLKLAVSDCDVKIISGMEGLCEAATISSANMTLNAVVGMIGLQPTMAAIEAGKTIALANKETLVAGGSLVMNRAKEKGISILPVDSEHSAVFQCLQGSPRKEALNRIILTASGGPFFGKTKEELQNVTLEQALNHPNWSMGKKITIDSATMMNKGLEIIEAAWLFDVPVDRIDVVVHRESIVHSMVEFLDGSVIAQMGVPDMRLPIQYAVTYPERISSEVPKLDLTACGNLTFYPPDEENFICLKACKQAFRRGGLAPAAANGANEMAVQLFMEGKIGFLDIGTLVTAAMEQQPDVASVASVAQVLEADRAARAFVLEAVNGH